MDSTPFPPLFSSESFADEFEVAYCQALNGVPKGNSAWTTAAKRALEHMASCEHRKLTVYSSLHKRQEDRRGEFLFDLLWVDRNRESPRYGIAELAAELEWGNLEQVCYDFEKLILAKGPLKFLLFDPYRKGEENQFREKLYSTLNSYFDHRKDETYIMATTSWDEPNRMLTLSFWYWKCSVPGKQKTIELTEMREREPQKIQ